MKITVINGQNHKGSTYNLGKMLVEEFKGADVKEFFLPKDFSDFCIGCATCFMKDETKCPHYNKLKPITDAIDDADLLIFTSPVYVYHATGQMKAFLDHYGWRWMVHRPEEKMFKKQAVIIATAAGAGMKSTIKDIKHSMFFWGVGKIYKFGVAVRAISFDEIPEKRLEKINNKLLRIAEKIRKKQANVKPKVTTRVVFSAMAFMNKKGGLNPADAEYWKNKGYTNGVKPWKECK